MTRTLHNYLTMRMHAGAADNVKGLLNRKMRVSQTLRKRESGFTLMEVMIVIAVIAIVAAIATPAFMKLLPGMRLNGSARDIFVTMNLARMQAVAKNSTGNIKFNSGTTYTAWVDNPLSGTKYALDNVDTLIKNGSTETGVTIGYVLADGGNTFAYNSRGLPSGTSGASTITLTNSEGAVQTVVVNALGIVKIP